MNVAISAANRDESKFPDPDRFDLNRSNRGHLAFGFGAHLCLGMNLARAELVALVETILDCMPRIRLDEESGDPVIVGSSFRSPPELHVRWD